MDLCKLRHFIVVAEELNFRRSAEILGMSQPPLTRLIASLEDELSTKLFERTTRLVKLTGAGVFLLKEGREILANAERIEAEIRSIGKLKAGSLTVGFSATAFSVNLPTILREFQDRFPKLKLQLNQEARDRILKGLKKGEFDVCFLDGSLTDDVLASQIVRDEELGLLVSKNHRFAKRKQIELQELKDETVILHPRKDNDIFYDGIHRLFKQHGIMPKIYLKNDRESCPILVAIGKGVSLTIANSQHCAAADTLFIPIKRLYLPVSVFWNPTNVNPSLKCFLSFVTESSTFQKRGAECLMDAMRL